MSILRHSLGYSMSACLKKNYAYLDIFLLLHRTQWPLIGCQSCSSYLMAEPWPQGTLISPTGSCWGLG